MDIFKRLDDYSLFDLGAFGVENCMHFLGLRIKAVLSPSGRSIHTHASGHHIQVSLIICQVVSHISQNNQVTYFVTVN